FFVQAEGGIRGRNVTGVQTCALPICEASATPPSEAGRRAGCSGGSAEEGAVGCAEGAAAVAASPGPAAFPGAGRCRDRSDALSEIGRASCRESVERAEAGGGVVRAGA